MKPYHVTYTVKYKDGTSHTYNNTACFSGIMGYAKFDIVQIEYNYLQDNNCTQEECDRYLSYLKKSFFGRFTLKDGSVIIKVDKKNNKNYVCTVLTMIRYLNERNYLVQTFLNLMDKNKKLSFIKAIQLAHYDVLSSGGGHCILVGVNVPVTLIELKKRLYSDAFNYDFLSGRSTNINGLFTNRVVSAQKYYSYGTKEYIENIRQQQEWRVNLVSYQKQGKVKKIEELLKNAV